MSLTVLQMNKITTQKGGGGGGKNKLKKLENSVLTGFCKAKEKNVHKCCNPVSKSVSQRGMD